VCDSERRLRCLPHQDAYDQEKNAVHTVKHVDEHNTLFVAHQDGLLILHICLQPLEEI